MQTGWVEIYGDWYYFGANGAAVTGWHNIDNKTYYFNEDGIMATGMQSILVNNNEEYYYFDDINENINSIQYEIATQEDLNDYLDFTGHNIIGDRVLFKNAEDLQFPEGEVYYLDSSASDIAKNNLSTYWYISPDSTGNIDFNSSVFLIGDKTSLYLHSTGSHFANFSKQIISNATFYGSVSNVINLNNTISNNNGNFNADLIKASNMEFKNLTFNNTQNLTDHIFDVMGCNHITFDNIKSNGYLGNYSASELTTYYESFDNDNKPNHDFYSEAIQIDISDKGASGIANLDATEIFSESLNDGTPSTDISIINSTFGPYNGATGQSIIDKTNTTVLRPNGATVGGHTGYTNGYANINISNNNFINTIHIQESMIKLLYPIHISTEDPSSVMTVENNVFTNLESQYYSDYGVRTNGATGYYGSDNNTTGTNTLAIDSDVNITPDMATSVKDKVVIYPFTIGTRLTGWKEIAGERFFFRDGTEQDSPGNVGSAITGLASINNKTYYFREDDSDGPMASMAYDECVIINNIGYCFNDDGELENTYTISTIPDSSTCNYNLTYTGNEQDLAIESPGYTLQNNTGINAGNYTITAVLNNDYMWSDGSLTNKTFSCSISKAKHPAPIITNYEGTYDGLPHTITLVNGSGKNVNYSLDGTYFTNFIPTKTDVSTINVYVKYLTDDNYTESDVSTGSITINPIETVISKADEINEVSIGFIGDVLTVFSNTNGMFLFTTSDDTISISTLPTSVTSGQTVALNVNAIKGGSATINISFVPTDATNYTEYHETFNLTVKNNIADIPTANDYCKNNLIYNGSNQTLTKSPGTGYTFINNSGKNAGDYNVTAHLNDNYEWSDNTTSDKVIVCSISKADIEEFTVTGYNGSYDGNSHTVTVSSVTGGTIKYSLDNVNWQTDPITRTDFGNTNVYVYVEGDQNHNNSTVKNSSITITKAIPTTSIQPVTTSNITQYNYKDFVSVTSNVKGTYTFTVDDEIIDNYPSQITAEAGENKIFSARGYQVGNTTLRVVFTPDNNNYQSVTQNIGVIVLENSDHIVDIPSSNSVCLNNLIYNGNSQILTTSPGNTYTFINNTGTNAGDYSVTVHLNESYKWSDNTTSDKTVTCSIAKADLVVPTITGYSGDYDGNPHYINVTEVSGSTIKYSLDNEYFTSMVPSRTDAGTTLVYVKYFGDNNHNDSSTYSANIIVNKLNSVISSINLVNNIYKGNTVSIGPVSANVDGVFTLSSNDSTILTTPVIYETVTAGQNITLNITGVKVGTTKYTITFTPNSSNYNQSSIVTDIDVVEAPKTPVEIPTSDVYCKTNLKYTGSPLTITNEPLTGYTFSNNVQTNVGSYTVTASLNDGYIWTDNTLSNKTFVCTILNADSYLTFNNSLVVNNGFIKPIINPPITYTELKSNISTNGTINTSKLDTDNVATCDTLSITLGNVVQNYTLVIPGDITKSGTVGESDVLLLFKYLRNKSTLNECQLKASDTTNDNGIFINDVAKLYQYVNGKIGGLNN